MNTVKINLSSLSSKLSSNSKTNSQPKNLTDYMKPDVFRNVERIKALAHQRYETRLKSVHTFCENKRSKIPKVERNNDLNITTARWRKEMWWDVNNGFAWCCVYKVASSSLVTHMINIAGWDWDEYLQHLVDIGIERRRWRDYMIEELYPLPSKWHSVQRKEIMK